MTRLSRLVWAIMPGDGRRNVAISMNRHDISILASLIRLLASTAIVPTALVAGMLSFPTTCQCGADQPHEHSIFEMPGHHHGDTREGSGGDREVVRAGVEGATVQASTGTATPALWAVQTTSPTLQPLPRAALGADAALRPDGHHSTPDVPPPQA
jgi:hypothetical protein